MNNLGAQVVTYSVRVVQLIEWCFQQWFATSSCKKILGLSGGGGRLAIRKGKNIKKKMVNWNLYDKIGFFIIVFTNPILCCRYNFCKFGVFIQMDYNFME